MTLNIFKFKTFFIFFFIILTLNGIVFAQPLNLNLLMIDDTSCSYCDLWEEEIGFMYSKSQEGKLAPLIRYQYGEKLPQEIKLLSEPVFTPTFILLEDNKEQYRIDGYPGEEFFWSFLSEYINKIQKNKNN